MLMQQHERLVYTGRLKASDRDFYGTPRPWVDAARRVMGGIELDPASCLEANEAIVRADRFFDESTNGLEQSWQSATLFLNPPYGKSLRRFSEKFCREWDIGCIDQAIVLINNTTETQSFDLFARRSSSQAQPRRRIHFVSVEGRCNDFNNTRGQVFFYFGNRVKTFARIFRHMDCRVLMEVG